MLVLLIRLSRSVPRDAIGNWIEWTTMESRHAGRHRHSPHARVLTRVPISPLPRRHRHPPLGAMHRIIIIGTVVVVVVVVVVHPVPPPYPLPHVPHDESVVVDN
eukprot:scaffold327678_cov41-Attheya_sp.AAC.1